MNSQDKKQQERLMAFDKNMFTYTGQIAWFLPAFFLFIDICICVIPFSQLDKGDTIMIWLHQYLMGIVASSMLTPYEWCTEAMTPRHTKDRTYGILKYMPISVGNYVRVRMRYLFRLFWKWTLFALAVQVIVALAVKAFHVFDFIYIIITCLFVPLLFGWISLRISIWVENNG